MATSALSANRTSQCDVRGEQVSSLVKIAEVNFICPHCASLYEIVRGRTALSTQSIAQAATALFRLAKSNSSSDIF
jgi:hypothetical protein